MSDTEKPFACPSPGCNMSFINEDHLTVHRKKHDMILNLGMNNKNIFIVDQTPTPTRFIRNCEEVGLFQDLQSVNPFEETFRRAVEGGKNSSSSVSDTEISDDTLHTPHIFPHITDCPATNSRIIHTDETIDELSSTAVTAVIDVATSSGENNLLDSSSQRDNVPNENAFQHIENTVNTITCTTNASPINSVTETRTHKTSPSVITKIAPKQSTSQLLNINGEDVQLLLKTADGKLMQLSAVPVVDNPRNSSSYEDGAVAASAEKRQTVVIKTSPALKCSPKSEASSSRLSLAKMKLKQVLTKGSVDSQVDQSAEMCDKEKNTRQSISPKESRVELRERNRASSMRCRAKRKEWIQQLQYTVNCANVKNAALQFEMKKLHDEISKLKTLLLAHKDCPVTKAMEKGNAMAIEPNNISISTDLASVIPVSSPVKRMLAGHDHTTDVIPVPPKKARLFSSMNPVALPKMNLQHERNIEKDTATVLEMSNVSSYLVVEQKRNKQEEDNSGT